MLRSIHYCNLSVFDLINSLKFNLSSKTHLVLGVKCINGSSSSKSFKGIDFFNSKVSNLSMSAF